MPIAKPIIIKPKPKRKKKLEGFFVWAVDFAPVDYFYVFLFKLADKKGTKRHRGPKGQE
jgi:hypothetical protein